MQASHIYIYMDIMGSVAKKRDIGGTDVPRRREKQRS